MKQIMILCALFISGCSTKEYDWDTGASRQQSFEQQRMEERIEETRDQNPEPVNAIRNQPF